MIYRVGIKNTKDTKEIRAASPLEAGTKYCRAAGFNYRVFANKIQIEERKKDNGK